MRPIYAQQAAPLPAGRASNRLVAALLWWIEFLRNPNQKTVEYDFKPESIHVSTDASSTPPRLAALTKDAEGMRYTDVAPSSALLDALCQRKDEQIMALEMLAVLLAQNTFREGMRSKRVHIWVDNSSGETPSAKAQPAPWTIMPSPTWCGMKQPHKATNSRFIACRQS